MDITILLILMLINLVLCFLFLVLLILSVRDLTAKKYTTRVHGDLKRIKSQINDEEYVL